MRLDGEKLINKIGALIELYGGDLVLTVLKTDIESGKYTIEESRELEFWKNAADTQKDNNIKLISTIQQLTEERDKLREENDKLKLKILKNAASESIV